VADAAEVRLERQQDRLHALQDLDGNKSNGKIYFPKTGTLTSTWISTKIFFLSKYDYQQTKTAENVNINNIIKYQLTKVTKAAK
jgi:hypothetical protein